MKKYTLEEFLEDLGARESSGNYSAVNSAGYFDKYNIAKCNKNYTLQYSK